MLHALNISDVTVYEWKQSMASAVIDFYHDNSMALDCMLIQLLLA